MVVLLFMTLVASSVCQGFIAQETKAGGLNRENSMRIAVLTIISVSMGLLLYYVASFGIEMYEYTKLDFYDYGDITAQGIIYFGAKLVGVMTVAEGAIHALICIALGVKNTNQ